MNDDTFWILLSTVIAGSLGLLLGVVLEDEVRRCQNAEQKVNEHTQAAAARRCGNADARTTV